MNYNTPIRNVNSILYQLKLKFINNRISQAVLSSTMAIVPFSVLRGLIVVASTLCLNFHWQKASLWLGNLQQTMLVFLPVLLNIVFSLQWAVRYRLSIMLSISFSLTVLLGITGLEHNHDANFLIGVSLPVALLSAIFTNLILEKNIKLFRTNKIKFNLPSIKTLLVFFSKILSLILIGHVILHASSWITSDIAKAIYPDNFIHGLLYELLREGTWFFGIHGIYIFQDTGLKLMNETMANIDAWKAGRESLNIISVPFYDTWCASGGCGGTLSLLICLLISRNPSNRHLIGVSLPLAIFNINEPLIFGVPVVLNPVMFIPFLMTPAMDYIIAYYATLWHIVPPMQQMVGWATPTLINAWIGTNGSINAILFQVFLIGMGIVIYWPFLRYMEKRDYKEINLPCGDTRFVPLKENQFQLSIPGHREVESPHHYLSEVNEYIDARRKINELQNSGNFVLWFQPQITLDERKIVAMEVLLRHQTDDGKITPPYFLKYYERLGMMPEVDFWVLETAIQTIHHELSRFPGMILSVNISPQTLLDPNFLSLVSKLMRQPLPSGWKLEMEITESQKVTQPEQVIEVLAILRQFGIKIALDDFGSGYSTLSYLTQYELDKIKLDRTLVLGLAREGGEAFLHHVVQLCKTSGCQVLIEGVETEEEHQIVQSCGIHLAQGFLFHRPQPINKLHELLEAKMY
ncbi:PTS system cellobiose-specific IIC component [Buttiauxella brennerae ATCC 51605]|uniref:PTS system cellobiose-specific IIC component n=1 Tax=Buttiauxella brennerae ATCC 51605 TaxID=1354251 RepID=A0A1B7ISI3_9ENTR|nr:EAL domain-containing protein [Buttiauxella brennerae]OAT32752.1 PTS system cellobiose-specific IIC component [Buttiauxella brennerae ATCC 51605]